MTGVSLSRSLLAIGIVGVAGYAVRSWRQNRLMGEVISGFEQLQISATKQIKPTSQIAGLPGPPEPIPPDKCFRHIRGLEFAYQIDQRPDGDYLHHVVGRQSGSSSGFLSEAMLLIMRRLVRQFSPAGLEHEVMLHVQSLDTGTQHIDFMVTPDQHVALLRVIEGESSRLR